MLLAVHAISLCDHWTDICGSLHHQNQLKEAFEEIIFCAPGLIPVRVSGQELLFVALIEQACLIGPQHNIHSFQQSSGITLVVEPFKFEAVLCIASASSIQTI